ncbi:hypothetical protein [Paraburkholderia kirstenboschensis]|uniref:hypothetical protein n=1 Tax=Paraburkholderia kirstenboschensis TaxID=1245436 RepID=UPI000FFB5F07|nr:hypothetical protein [Paraburkholderia kirstenboschensis]
MSIFLYREDTRCIARREENVQRSRPQICWKGVSKCHFGTGAEMIALFAPNPLPATYAKDTATLKLPEQQAIAELIETRRRPPDLATHQPD